MSIAIFPLFLTSCDLLAKKNPQEIKLLAKQSIVSVSSEYESDSGESQNINATGFFISAKENTACTILTVGHIALPNTKLQVQAGGKKWQVAPENIKTVPNLDLALIELSKSTIKCSYPSLPLGDSDRISRGSILYIMGYIRDKRGMDSQKLDPVIAAGISPNPLGYKMSYTPTAIIPGSPVLDKSGKVVGVHGSPEIAQALLEDTELSQLYSYNSNLAIPINTAKAKIKEIDVNQDLYIKIATFAVGGTIGIAITFWIGRMVFFLVFPPICFWCGMVLFWLKDDKALTLYDLSLRFKPNFSKVYHNRGHLLWMDKKYQEAYESFFQGIKLNRNKYADGTLYQTLSARNRQGNETLVKLYNLITQINPNDALSFKQCASALAKLQRYQDAEIANDKAIALNRDDANSWFQQGQVKTKLKKHSEAVICFDRAEELEPENMKTCLERGLAKGDI